MSCGFSKEVLALYAGGDLSDSSFHTTEAHLAHCVECRRFCDSLEQSQLVLRSLRKTTAGAAELGGVRQEVLSRIDRAPDALGLALRIERFIFVQFLKRPYAFAVVSILAIVSLSMVAQMRSGNSPGVVSAAMFGAGDELAVPSDYQEWIAVGNSSGANWSRAGGAAHAEVGGLKFSPKVYIDPSAYRSFQSTGNFPEGTVMVLESRNDERNIVELQVSVKDSSRFAGGWGFFGFVDRDGIVRSRAEAYSDATGCRGCHEARAETDHVFTQFYPMLRVRRG